MSATAQAASRATQQNDTVLLKADGFNLAVTLNTNILPKDITPTQAPVAFFDIYVCFDAAGTLSIMRTKAGVTLAEQMLTTGVGNALVANTGYGFVIPVTYNTETINLQYSVSALLKKINIVEELK